MTLYPDTLTYHSLRYVVADAPAPDLWRVLHEAELPEDKRETPLGRPEVRPMFPNHFSDFGREAQLLSRAMNPRISDDKWTAVYGYMLWITNRQGFGNDADPRANYITGKNLTCDNPRVECLTTGGSLLKGQVSGDNLIVETLDVNNLPSLEWLKAHPEYWTYAVNNNRNQQPGRFPQGLQPSGEVVPIIHPLIANPSRYTITIPLYRVVRWTEANPPDPYRIYLPR